MCKHLRCKTWRRCGDAVSTLPTVLAAAEAPEPNRRAPLPLRRDTNGTGHIPGGVLRSVLSWSRGGTPDLLMSDLS